MMTSVLGPTSIRVTFTQPSGSLAADSYDIQYARVTGAGQTLCASVEDTGATTDVQSPFTITDLEEFSSYDITVTARVFSAMHPTTEQAMTSPAGVINCFYMIMDIRYILYSSSCYSPGPGEHYCPLHFHHCWMGPSGVYRTKWSVRQLHCAVWTRRWSAE